METRHDVSTNALFYWGCCSACQRTAAPGRSLLRCSRCHGMYYCSPEHQRQHWPEHRPFCRFLAGQARLAGQPSVFQQLQGLGRLQMANHMKVLVALWEVEVAMKHRRAITYAEKDMLIYPRVCYAPSCGLAAPVVEMLDCSTCRAVSYCGPEHRDQEAEQHAGQCKHLRLARLLDLHELQHDEQEPCFPPGLDIQWLGEKSTLTHGSNMFDELEKSISEGDQLCAAELELSALSEQLSAPLTLLQAAASLLPQVGEARELRLHMVGVGGGKAAGEMVGSTGRWEYLAHRLPALRRLWVAMVGPDLPEQLPDTQEVCGGCQELGRKVEVVWHRGTYSQYQLGTRPDSLATPDLVLVQNCGFSCSTWTREGLRSLLHTGVPLLFTSYDEEGSKSDLATLMTAVGSGLEVVRGPEENSLRSRRGCVMEPKVFFTNAILTIVRKNN